MAETVNHPSHYGGDVPHETWKCLCAWGLESDAILWTVVKYISRAGKKGDILEDLRKAQWFLQLRIDSIIESRKSGSPASGSTPAPTAATTYGLIASGRVMPLDATAENLKDECMREVPQLDSR